MSRSGMARRVCALPYKQRPQRVCAGCGKRRRVDAGLCASCVHPSERHVALTSREKKVKQRYGISHTERDAIAERQGWCCAGCLTPLADWRSSKMNAAVLDHCHLTGEVRGVLCRRCNVDLGGYERVASWAQSYLERKHV